MSDLTAELSTDPSEVPATTPASPATGAHPAAPSASRLRPLPPLLAVVVLALLPLYLDQSWLLIGILAMAAAVAAIGLTVLIGTAGQLSLAHAFFMATGAYGYAYLAGAAEGGTTDGLGLPPALAAIAATALAGICGLAFGPVAARLNGLYLGVASLALVFIGAHALTNLEAVTGGYNGREVAPLTVLGAQLSGTTGTDFSVLGVPYGGTERLWYVALLALALALVAASRVVRGRPGRALQLMRDNAMAAGSMGVPIRRYKLGVFAFSSLFAGAGGVLTALAFEFLVPHYFDLHLSVLFLAMVIIGGLGSVRGAVAGAVFVTSLPLLLERVSGSLDLLAEPGSGGLDPTTVSRFVFGAALVLVLVTEPLGIAGLVRRTTAALRRRLR